MMGCTFHVFKSQVDSATFPRHFLRYLESVAKASGSILCQRHTDGSGKWRRVHLKCLLQS